MINAGKCPYCDTILRTVIAEDVVMNVNFTPQWKGFSYHCPSCKKILSVEMNPLTLQSDTVKEILKKFGR